MYQIHFTNLDNASGSLQYDEMPDDCPTCHQGISPKPVVGICLGEPNNESSRLRIAFQCTRRKCQEAFFGYYDFQVSPPHYVLKEVGPITAATTQFSESINKVSTNFVEIYNQAISAESFNLHQIAGLGLRKAIEFLIKDFAISQNPDDEEKIKELFLGDVIKQYINDPDLKDSAELATWLANDETHYVRRWLNKDIKDVKNLIDIAVNSIDRSFLLAKYRTEMKPVKKT
jgi:hypothetical protein